MTERERFDKWAKGYGWTCNRLQPSGLYADETTQSMWEAWQDKAREQAEKIAKLEEACVCAIRCIQRNSTQKQKDWTVNHIRESLSRDAGTQMGYCDQDHRYPSPTMEGQGPQHPHIKVSTCKNWRDGTKEKK